MVIAVKKGMVLFIVCLQVILLSLFFSMTLHLMRMNHEIEGYEKELVNYKQKVKQEKKTKKDYENKINELTKNQQSKKDRLVNLETVKETTKKSIKNIKGKIGE